MIKKDAFSITVLILLFLSVVFLLVSLGYAILTYFVTSKPVVVPERSNMTLPVTDKMYVEPVEKSVTTPEPNPEEMVEDESEEVEQVSYSYDGYHDYPESGLTPYSGVNYYGGRTETYYSSNVLRHYRIDEWTAGSDGVWRDSDGYVVVASSDYGQGTELDTSFGPARVYDTGCASGVVDIYVNW